MLCRPLLRRRANLVAVVSFLAFFVTAYFWTQPAARDRPGVRGGRLRSVKDVVRTYPPKYEKKPSRSKVVVKPPKQRGANKCGYDSCHKTQPGAYNT